MDISVNLRNLNGSIKVIPSKSYAHRILIASALSDKPTVIDSGIFSDDIRATVNCLRELGAIVTESDNKLTVEPVREKNKKVTLDCNESGTTSRLILPVASVLSEETIVTGRGRLPERPMDELVNALSGHGVSFMQTVMPINMKGAPHCGEYKIKGNISSQYISGLLFLLPLLDGESELVLTTTLESKAYVEMTLEILSMFGIEYKKTEKGYSTKPQKYISPGSASVEADWSNAAFFVAANKLGANINIKNLNEKSIQGDSAIRTLLDSTKIDASEIPDLVPILSVLACARNEDTVIYNAKRLRLKESDRLFSVASALNVIGGNIEEKEDGLIIHGKGYLEGGISESFNDHRIVMSLSVASLISKNPIVIKNAEAVNKSYPGFFDELKKLGGDINVLHNR